MPRRRPAPRPAAAGARAGWSPPRWVVIDGRNVQRALERGAGPGSLPTFALIARLRGAFSGTDVELVLDGHAAGSPSGKVAPGFTVTFSRGLTADRVIAERVAERSLAVGPAGSDAILVVSDDREVRDDARRNGARVEGTRWLVERLDHPAPASSATPGRRGATGAAGGAGGTRGTGGMGGTGGDAPAARPRPGTTLGHGRPPRAPWGGPDRRAGRSGSRGPC